MDDRQLIIISDLVTIAWLICVVIFRRCIVL